MNGLKRFQDFVKFVINAKAENERQPNALQQELEQNHQDFTEAQIIAFCPLNVVVWVAFLR